MSISNLVTKATDGIIASARSSGPASMNAVPASLTSASLNMALPTDTLFSQQFYLRNTTPGLLDLNIMDVWDSTGTNYTGNGVRIAVIDDGLQRAHHDLNDNVDVNSDWDFFRNDTDPTGVDGDNHGTSVAGIIASERNGVGTVGVAYDSTIFGFRVQSSGALPGLYDLFVAQLTEAIKAAGGLGSTGGVNAGAADIANMSNGTQLNANFYDLDVPTQALMTALNTAIDDATSMGRGGLGTILVKSAGNGRTDSHDANASSWNANKNTISVAAVDQNGFISSYSTPGSNVLISGFGTPGDVVTTDRIGAEGYNTGGANADYNFGFNGTSSAAPMVTGVIALMLEANPGLGWRDVQEILAYSARHVGSAVGGGISGSEWSPWQWNNASTWNGGGLHFSKDYGFGLVDGLAAVRLAETWKTTARTSANDVVANQDLLNSPETIDGVVAGGNTAGTSGTEDFVWTETTQLRVEQIEITMTYSHTFLADMDITLISPDGTTQLVSNDVGSNLNFDGTWTWTTNAFWGEKTAGIWTLRLTDDASGDEWLVTDIQVNFYGSSVSDAFRMVVTNEFSDYAAGPDHSATLSGTAAADDILNAAAVTSGSTIDMRAGTGTIDGVAVTLSGFETIYTGDGADTVTSGTVASTLEYISTGRGNDTIIKAAGTSSTGTDTFDGGAGIDTFVFDYGSMGTLWEINLTTGKLTYNGSDRDTLIRIENVTVTGSGTSIVGNDSANTLSNTGMVGISISGMGGDDTLNGGSGADTLDGGAGTDVVSGGTGSDVYKFSFDSSEQDTISEGGGGGTDRIIVSDYSLADLDFRRSSNLLIVEKDGSTGKLIIEDHFSGVATERIEFFEVAGKTYYLKNTNIGTSTDDIIVGASASDTINGVGGDDMIVGGGGADTLTGGAGIDIVRGGTGSDVYKFSFDSSEQDTISEGGGGGTDRIIVSDYTLADLDFRRSSNLLIVEKEGSTGKLIIEDHFSGVATERIEFFEIAGKTYYLKNTNVGTSTDDIIVGASVNDVIDGAGGDDMIVGGGGNDTLTGGAGDDILVGGSGNDNVKGGAGNDTYRFNFGSDGQDTISENTGSGTDTLEVTGRVMSQLDFRRFGEQLIIESGGTSDTIVIDGFYSGIATDRIEILETTTSTKYLQTGLIGGGAGDVIVGAAAGETLIGNGGDDILIGKGGKDRLYGGSGADRFDYDALSDSGTSGTTMDTIYDFVAGTDRIDLFDIDADSTTAGNQNFSFIGAGAYSGTAGELRYQFIGGNTRLGVDVDGDMVDDFNILLAGNVAFSAGDFVL